MLEEMPDALRLALEPLDDYVVIQPSDEETETRAGLIIPASAEAGCRTGIVTAVGPDVGSLEPGDKVLLLPSTSLYEQQERLQEFISTRFAPSTPFSQQQQNRGIPNFLR